jgi:hypothetical protein
LAVYPLLAVLWALVLVPPLVRRRIQTRAEFPEFDRMRLSLVGSTTTATTRRPETPPPAVRRSATQRRRRVLALIGAGMIATLVAAIVMRTRLAWGMHLLIYDVLIAYVALLARARDKQTVRRPTVAPLGRPVSVAPARRIPRPPALPARVAPSQVALLQTASR